jgi:hypothetical protein
MTEAEAEHSVTNYARSWITYDLTKSIVLEAVRGLQRHRLSYWDSLIWADGRAERCAERPQRGLQRWGSAGGRAFPKSLYHDFRSGLALAAWIALI